MKKYKKEVEWDIDSLMAIINYIICMIPFLGQIFFLIVVLPTYMKGRKVYYREVKD